MMIWHSLTQEELFTQTGSAPEGLSNTEAADRLTRHGANELIAGKKKPAWLFFVLQFRDFMILILIAAAVISGIMGDITDTIIILVIVLLNAITGFAQEFRAEKAMDALKKLVTIQSVVLRDKHPVKLSSVQLVPGDIVLLEAGNVVPADIRLLESNSLQIDESSLTGESVPTDKTAAVIPENDVPVGDRLNMAYKGTLITSGRGQGIVIATGMSTEIGAIARMLQMKESITPLQKRMTDFSKKLSYVVLAICVLYFISGLLRGEDAMEMVLLSISLAVAAIPEALPALITITLARGANKLVKKQVLIRKLRSVETLGSVSYICSDKTGTLTINKMTVTETHEAPGLPLLNGGETPFMVALALNHDVRIDDEKKLIGDPTEIALVLYADAHLREKSHKALSVLFPRVAELPFDADRKCMTTLHQYGDKILVLTKGAAESVTDRLKDRQEKKAILQTGEDWAKNGLRVLAFAYAIMDSVPETLTPDAVEKDLSFAGLTGMIDPPRKEVKAAIAECKSAGIKTVMITGDHPSTAAAIASQIGLMEQGDLVVSGAQLSAMTEPEFSEKVEMIRVYARVSPEQKLQIIKALQNKAHFVAMTGDGVNDAPSLKSANIGIAMGINGTEVSKEASHMILMDDNFATIVNAVKEGRKIYDNILKFVKYIMTCNSAEIWIICLAPFLGLPTPLLPIHILWINLVTDGLPGLALSGEKAERDIMHFPPRKISESLFSGTIGFHIIWVGILMAAVVLGTQFWAIGQKMEHWQTMVFTVLSITQLGHVMAIRSHREFLYKQGLFSNLPLLGAVAFTFLLQMAVIYLPVANTIFKTSPLTLRELLICIGLSAIIFHAVELEKWIKVSVMKKRR